MSKSASHLKIPAIVRYVEGIHFSQSNLPKRPAVLEILDRHVREKNQLISTEKICQIIFSVQK